MEGNNVNTIEVKYVDQRHEGIDAWIRRGQGVWIRLDFILEYFLTGNVVLSKKYKGRLSDSKITRQYYETLYSIFLDKTSGGHTFDFQKYLEWQRNNLSDIKEARELLYPA